MKIDRHQRALAFAKISSRRSAYCGKTTIEPRIAVPGISDCDELLIEYQQGPESLESPGEFLRETLVQIKLSQNGSLKLTIVASVGEHIPGEIDFLLFFTPAPGKLPVAHDEERFYSRSYAVAEDLDYDPIEFEKRSDLFDELVAYAASHEMTPTLPRVRISASRGERGR